MSKVKHNDLLTIELLDINSRDSIANISKEVGISKQAMISKIQNLEKEGFCQFVPVIDYFKLGYHNIHIYLKLQGMGREEYLEKIRLLEKIKNITWLEEFIGEYDLAISVFYNSIKDLYNILDKVYYSFKDSIREKELHFIYEHIIKNFSFGLTDKKIITIVKEKDCLFSPSKMHKKILDLIKSNGRFSYVDLVDKLKISYQQVRYHIKKIEEQGMILRYKSIINYNKIGYHHYICILKTVPGRNIDIVLKELKLNNLIPFISITLENNVILDFVCESHDELKDFLDKLKSKYAKIIEEFKILNIKNLIKLDYLID